jgi:hypothetical protein
MTRFYFTLYDDDRETKNDGIMKIRLNRYTFLVQFRCRRRITDCAKAKEHKKMQLGTCTAQKQIFFDGGSKTQIG